MADSSNVKADNDNEGDRDVHRQTHTAFTFLSDDGDSIVDQEQSMASPQPDSHNISEDLEFERDY